MTWILSPGLAEVAQSRAWLERADVLSRTRAELVVTSPLRRAAATAEGLFGEDQKQESCGELREEKFYERRRKVRRALSHSARAFFSALRRARIPPRSTHSITAYPLRTKAKSHDQPCYPD